MQTKKNVLIAPLNWGLGHATRCIPIIQELEKNGFNPIIASDGIALDLLKKEFPHLLALELPSYNIKYAKKGRNFLWKQLLNSSKIISAIYKEKKILQKLITQHQLIGVISDNRLGLSTKKIPSVFITHQLNVIAGNLTSLFSKSHQYIIKKYSECWVPDTNTYPNLSGKLGHLQKPSLSIKYIGPLSRFQKKELPLQYQLMVILSGPEPQRTMLEVKLIAELKEYPKKVIFIKGKVEQTQKVETINNITFYNFMQSCQLEQTFNECELVLCRSGYTTIMDLAKLEKKAFFIPTPGQYEQEYLAKKFKDEGMIPYSKQEKFKISGLNQVMFYKGLPKIKTDTNWEELFSIFKN